MDRRYVEQCRRSRNWHGTYLELSKKLRLVLRDYDSYPVHAFYQLMGRCSLRHVQQRDSKPVKQPFTK